MHEDVVVHCCFHQQWLHCASWMPSKSIADSQQVPIVSTRGSIFVPVSLHIEEDVCPPIVVDMRQISSTTACRSDEVKIFYDKFNVDSSSVWSER